MSDLIRRADAIEAVRSFFKDLLGKSKCDYDDELQVYVISKEEKTLLIYSKRINDKLRSLPSAETHDLRTETHGVCLISKDDAMGAVQDHFNDNGFKGYDDGQKMMDRINALPAAEAEHGHGDGQWYDLTDALTVERNEWIPVEEQPPEFPCLVCDANGNQPSVPLGIVTITDEEHGEWHIDGRLWDSPKVFVDGEWGNQISYGNRIIAWMPLPKPYREDGEA